MVIMSFKIQRGILSFDEISFPREPSVGTMVVQITGFTSIVIIGFDPSIVKVGDLTFGVA